MQSTLTRHTQAIHATPLGPMVSVWTDAGLHTLSWQTDGQRIGEPFQTTGKHHSPSCHLGDCLKGYFDTGVAEFDSVRIDTQGWTPFTETVYRNCREIASGTTVTYKQLAASSGNELASRAVGAAMARNRVLLVIPCHRVVSASGGLRGFSAPGGLNTKQFLLDLES